MRIYTQDSNSSEKDLALNSDQQNGYAADLKAKTCVPPANNHQFSK
ncbi:hypothetical protein OROHE_016000 [Orobanche hederae]